MKWSVTSKKKGSYNAQWIRKCVCCQVCEVGVLRRTRCLLGATMWKTPLKYKDKELYKGQEKNLMRKSKAQAHVEPALNKALNNLGRP